MNPVQISKAMTAPILTLLVVTALAPRLGLHRLAKPVALPPISMAATSTGDGGGDERSGRVAIAVLATAGAAETGTLTVEKLWPSGALDGFCLPGGGCADVLSGSWSTVFGVPLSAFGLLAYGAVAALAASPLLLPAAADVDGDANVAATEAPGASALVFGAGALAAFSACLMLLLLLVIQQPCMLCFASAALSASILVVTWRTPLVRSRTDATVFAGSGALLSAAAAVALYVGQSAAVAGLASADLGVDAALGPVAPPAIQAHSSARALALASKLQARGARFYGAYWCSHCRDQKEALGAEAMKLLQYYECDANGKASRRAECMAAGIKGYPTWELGGALFPGERDLDELERMLAGEVEPDGLNATK